LCDIPIQQFEQKGIAAFLGMEILHFWRTSFIT